MCAIVRSLICEREDLDELESLVASTIICLNDYDILIGGRKSTGELVLTDWVEMSASVLVKRCFWSADPNSTKIAWK